MRSFKQYLAESTTAQDFEAKTGISKEDYEAYESVRQSGVTNMFDVRTVMQLSGLDRQKIMAIMKNYTEARKVYEGK